jgi:hypothetical protein
MDFQVNMGNSEAAVKVHMRTDNIINLENYYMYLISQAKCLVPSFRENEREEICSKILSTYINRQKRRRPHIPILKINLRVGMVQ